MVGGSDAHTCSDELMARARTGKLTRNLTLGVLQLHSDNMPPVDRARRVDSDCRKRKRRTGDENMAPPATRTSLKRRKSVMEAVEDTDTMDLDSGASVHEDDEQAQSGECVNCDFIC